MSSSAPPDGVEQARLHHSPVPTGAELRGLTRAARRGHGGAPLSQLIGDVYTYAFVAVVAMALAVSAAHTLGADFAGTTSTASLDPAWLWIVVSIVVAGLALGVLARLGPIGVGGAGALWWLPTPVDRLSLLRPTALSWIVVTAGIGALAGGAIGALTRTDLVSVAWAVLAGAGLGAALAALVAITQTVRTSQAQVRHLALVGDLAVALAVAGWIGVALARLAAPVLPAAVIAGIGVVAGIALSIVLVRRLGQIPGAALRERGARTGMATSAIVTLDFRELGRVLTDPGRDLRRRTLPMSWVTGPASAVVTADSLLLLRAPRQLVMLVASLGLPIAIAGSGTSEILAAGAFVVGVYLAANASAVGAREAEHSPALDRAFGVSARAVRLLRLMVPTLVCFVWSVAALAFLRGDLGAWIPLLVLFAPGIAASAVKAAYRNPPNWSAPLVVTPMGAYPPGVVNSLATGPILAIIASLPVIVALFVGPQQIIGMVQVIITSILVLVASHTKRRK